MTITTTASTGDSHGPWNAADSGKETIPMNPSREECLGRGRWSFVFVFVFVREGKGTVVPRWQETASRR